MSMFRPLAGPHAAIRVNVQTYFWGYFVEYQGPSLEALVAAECITAQMAACMTVRQFGGSQRRDEDGDSYRMRKLPSKREPERVQVGRYINTEKRPESGVLKAQALPGVRECLGGTAGPKVDRTYPDAWLHRVRRFGRRQQPIRWTCIEKLILPDWAALQASVARARAS